MELLPEDADLQPPLLGFCPTRRGPHVLGQNGLNLGFLVTSHGTILFGCSGRFTAEIAKCAELVLEISLHNVEIHSVNQVV